MFFVKFFLAQAVAITIIVAVLKKILDQNLVDLAIRQFERFSTQPPAVSPAVIVTTHKKLSSRHESRIRKAAARIFGQTATVEWRIDKAMWGGMTIRTGDSVIQYSLRERVHQAFL